MGRPYRSDLNRVPATIDWALREDVSALSYTLLREFRGQNLVAIGSGGSLVAASFAALLHEAVNGRLARATTPLEAVTRPPPRNTAALLLSARGTNSDIRRVAEMLPSMGYDPVSAVTARKASPLARMLTKYGALTHEFDMPGGRDGFLATNSLIATLVLLYRAALSSDHSLGPNAQSLAESAPNSYRLGSHAEQAHSRSLSSRLGRLLRQSTSNHDSQKVPWRMSQSPTREISPTAAIIGCRSMPTTQG